MRHFKMILLGMVVLLCSARSENLLTTDQLNDNGSTIATRFVPPKGYTRQNADEHSFANYLRNLPLKAAGAKVKYYDGTSKEEPVYDAVVDMDITTKDLQQCADAVMRLRGEYLYSQQKFDQISFHLTNGFKVDYKEWIQGNRVEVKGNQTLWKKTTIPSNTYRDFRNYMDFVFTYAGTQSLSRELKPKDVNDISIGDVFIYAGSPGHAVIVVDVAVNKTGEKIFLIAQSYMPAQETQVLKNLNDPALSPWYRAHVGSELYTPQWTFKPNALKTW